MIGMAWILSVPVSGPFTVALLSMSLIGPASTSSFSRIGRTSRSFSILMRAFVKR